MPLFKLSFVKPMTCMSEASHVHDPRSYKDKEEIKEKEARVSSSSSVLSECSRRTLSNLRDVFHGSKRHADKVSSSSPRSMVSSDFLNPLVVRPKRLIGVGGDSPVHPEGSCVDGEDFYCFSSLVCKRCCEKFKNLDALESHHFSKHAVTELAKGDSSRTIVEIIFDTNWSNPDLHRVEIDKVLKVCNLQATVSRFEEYRDTVKIRASKLPTKHARCLADGNELLRFYGTTLGCPLGSNGSSGPCASVHCGVCRILRNGFSRKDATNNVGVYTTSTSGRAFEKAIEIDQKNQQVRKALLVCRVIAGRVHKPMEDLQQLEGQMGFDSVAGKIGKNSKIEELYSLDPRALLPCFVIVCRGPTCDLVPDSVSCRHQASSLSQFGLFQHFNLSK